MTTTTTINLKKITKAFLKEDVRLGEIAEKDESGHPFIICTNIARFLKENFFPQAEIKGYSIYDNPEAEIGQDCDGHDFIVIDGRYILEFWYKHVECVEDCPVLIDIQEQPELVKKYYGDPATWVTLK